MPNLDISITDNSDKILQELKSKSSLILAALGEIAEGHAKDDCPVDTGRLRNSIAYATEKEHSKANTSGGQAADPEEYETKATPETGTVYIGTNVEYAPAQEYGDYTHTSGKKHFLRDAVANHKNEYLATIKASLKA